MKKKKEKSIMNSIIHPPSFRTKSEGNSCFICFAIIHFQNFHFCAVRSQIGQKIYTEYFMYSKRLDKTPWTLSLFFGNDTVCLMRHIIHNKERQREKSWLTHMPLFCFHGKAISLHTAYLHRKYLIRNWRMTHFVSYHQWVLFQLPRKTTLSQYTSEVTVNQQALTPMW
jgi:hypothetical protein